MGNSNLHSAKKAKNDEFYTQIETIENELIHYREQFRGKVVFLNADDPEYSNFWKFFKLQFKVLGLKKLMATHYNETGPTYKLEYYGIGEPNRIDLKGNGDFRSEEVVEILKEADIVCTNPPFSLFREYIAQLMEYDKKFLVIGNFNAITYKDIFPLIKEDKMWVGIIGPRSMDFITPSGETKSVNATWYTNLYTSIKNEEIYLSESYIEEKYPYYDNYDAINVNRVAQIPKDWKGVMGVPIGIINKYNPKQFEILGIERYYAPKSALTSGRFTIKGKILYARILIQNKRLNPEIYGDGRDSDEN